MKSLNDSIGFYIIYGVAFIFMLYLVWSRYKICFTAKAGEADKYVFKIGVGKRLDKKKSDDKKKWLQLLVNGNSMADYGIFNGNSIWVQKYDEAERGNIVSFPVLVLSLVNPIKKSDSLYKLRKFVGYVDNNGNGIDWDKVYEKYKSRVKPSVSKDEFVASCKHSYDKSYERLKNDDRIVLSETFDEIVRKYHYSVHAVSQVYAKVKYAA